MKYEQSNGSRRSRLAFFPFDLAAAVAFALAGTVVLFIWDGSLLRAAVGVPLLLFLPGYVVVAVAFPGSADTAASDQPFDPSPDDPAATVDGVERAALSFGMSVALLPVVAVAVAASPFPLSRPVVVAAFVGLICVGAVTAAVRRARLARHRRYRVPVGRWVADLRAGLFGTDRRYAGLVNAALVVSVLLATATMGYALAVPQDGESYSSIALLTENESGELEATDYPTNLTAGDPAELVVSVENNEGAETNYTVVAVVQRVEPAADGVRVLEQRELDRFEAAVGPGETWRRTHAAVPDLVGDRIRLHYYLYRGDVPEAVNADTAYRSAYLSVDVNRGA
ncbi:DUF1616 domain-containing protein [Halostella salina]|uniref:DUF1616 domain-containing protein n=1 Tax=Halostella salina TaxID=1547897 RepID=UPI000EF7FD3C|nr:DUF1616 domain-containing protein [Halostella salina]